ncbi:MAG: type II/IV secretion system ATPase subunit, partial [Candidatus Woesearchaeota archaeon]
MEHRREAKNLHKTQTMQEAMEKYPHFRNYIQEVTKKMGEPQYITKLERSHKAIKRPNIVYPIGDPIFVHIYLEEGRGMRYIVIEPVMNEREQKLYNQILDKLVEVAHTLPIPDKNTNITEILVQLLDKIIEVKTTNKTSIFDAFSTKIRLTQQENDIIRYYIIRNRVGYGKLEPVFNDSYLEDIHCTGVGALSIVHKIFGMVYTNIEFKDDEELNRYIVETTERVERPASDAHSVIDAMMPDGSRSNFIYGRDISLEGSSFTIRKFAEVPVSVTQIVNWGTMSSEEAAYLWICLENGMNLFVCGETASGKTTTLNAIAVFIKPEDKIYTVENTPEVTMPHETWQHLLSREAGKATDVTLFDLLIAALRSRPNYIIVGEIRGAEGNIAFQAMQTGHPVMSTFHAGNVTSMIQRLTGPPINVPIASIDNLNLSLIQQAVENKGQRVRRVMSITEIESNYATANKMVTRQVFEWNPIEDVHIFRG